MFGPIDRISALPGFSAEALSQATATSRRGFLAVFGLGAAGFAVGCTAAGPGGAASEAAGMLNAFVRVGADNVVTVLIKHQDKGQGISTGLSKLVAEEMDADWGQMAYDFAPADVKKYANTFFGIMQATGGSTGMANSYMQMRQAGAAARAMLVAAATKAWGVPAGEITVAKGVLGHASGKSATFGEMAEAAGAETAPDPATLPLKDPKDFKIIGQRTHRLDSKPKSTGAQVYTQDIHQEGMLTAVVAHPPKFGATVKGFDPSAAKAVPGVTDVVETPRGVAVLATNTWAAMRGREALKVDWDETRAEKRGTPELIEEYKAIAKTPGIVVLNEGDVKAGLACASCSIDATYVFPFLAHATMEPMNAVVSYQRGRGAEIWSGHQIQTLDQGNAAAVLGLKPEQVKLHTLAAGGSFGRRAVPDSDYVAEACMIARAIDGRAPVKLVWTREDDLRGGRYRPMAVHDVRVGVTAEGNISAWKHTVVCQSFMKGSPFEMMMKDGVDPSAVEGLHDMAYEIPSIDLQLHQPEIGVTALWWRSVGHTHTAYVLETMLDRVAAHTNRDPIELRRSLIPPEDKRRLGVLNLAAEKAGWAGRGTSRGVSLHKSFGTYVAQIADVSIRDGAIMVDRIVCAVDCGVAVDPDAIVAQMEGGIGYGLSAILHEGVTLTGGVVDQSSFADYRVLRIDEMPKIEVYIVPSTEPPTGVGEPGTPPIGPAIANAIFSATAKHITVLPMGDQLRTA